MGSRLSASAKAFAAVYRFWNRRRHAGIIALAIAGLTVPSVLAADPAAVPTPTVSVLEKDANPRIGPGMPPAYLDVLAKQGLIVGFPDAKAAAPLTWERLKRFNLLIMTSFTHEHAVTGSLQAGEGDRVADLLDRYLREGGGILYIGQALMASHLEHDDLNQWLKPHGAEFEWATIEDDQHNYTNPPPVPWQRPNYLWTANIAASPLTAEVKTLFFQNSVFYSPSIRPLKVSADWQVPVSTEASAKITQLTRPAGGDLGQKIAGSERTGAVPLIAVRQIGKGRLALFGADPGPFYYDLGKPVGAKVCSERGDGTRTSDWLPLLRNLCVWLSEPAQAAGFPGGETTPGKAYINPEYGNRDAINWERPDLSWPDSELNRLATMHTSLWKEADWRALAAGEYPSFRFLVGAHSARSGGKGSVADWKAAAIKAGFAGVVFREKILELTSEQWQAFETECKAASDDTFFAVPGQEFEDWEGNRFMRFNQDIPYFKEVRLAKDKKHVQHQLHFFFDAGWPANLPLLVKGNPTAFWNYRVYSAWPLAVYQGGKRIEDNQAEWASLVDRMEYPTPLAVHLLEDPAEVAAAAGAFNMMLVAPSLKDLRENPRWQRVSMGTGLHNSLAAYVSNGPVIEAFLPMNMYRTTLGDRDVPGSHRYRLVIRARSTVPLTRIELWGDGQCLRRYQPNQSQAYIVTDELHDRERGLALRVTDAAGHDAFATTIMVHDKMMVFGWCGDHCNALPYGQGVDAAGNPAGFGIATHVKGMYQAAGGPGASFSEGNMFIPWGTDTSAPTLGITGEVTFAGQAGEVPAGKVQYVPDLRFWYATRDAMITRMTVTLLADHEKYNNEYYGGSYLSGWGPYFKTQPLEEFDIVSDDIDFQRDAGQPALQLCRGEIRFKKELTLNGKTVLNLTLAKLGWNVVKLGLQTAAGKVPQPGTVQGRLGRGKYLTWGGNWGHGTVFALDDEFGVDTAIDATGKAPGRPAFGYAFGERTFKPGEVFAYRFLIMRWPVGMALEEKLDAKVAAALNLAGAPLPSLLKARQGDVLATQMTLDVQAKDNVFRGTLQSRQLGMRVPVRVKGVNPNWAAGLWREGMRLFVPGSPDPDGWMWAALDPAADAGEIMLGNFLTCSKPEILLRLLQRSDGGWDVLAHNPTGKKLGTTVHGADGGPVAGWKKDVVLQPGEEVRLPLLPSPSKHGLWLE